MSLNEILLTVYSIGTLLFFIYFMTRKTDKNFIVALTISLFWPALVPILILVSFANKFRGKDSL